MRTGLALLLLLLVPAPVSAQHVSKRFAPTDSVPRESRGWTALRVAKWSTLAAATGAVAYGFVENRAADRDYTDIERICAQLQSRCERVSENGPYQDAALEGRYQSVIARDRRARNALLAGQLGIATSVVLFVLDLPKSAAPEDIPYQPRPFRVGVVDGHVQLTGHLTLP